MIDNEMKVLFRQAVTNADVQSKETGILGKKVPSNPTVYDVKGRPGYKWVTRRDQTFIEARAKVALPNEEVAVEFRLENGDYVILGRSVHPAFPYVAPPPTTVNWADIEDIPASFPPSSHAASHKGAGSDLLNLTTDDVAEGILANRNYITDAEQIKLAGIETAADVTDQANVGAALDTAPDLGAPVGTDKIGGYRAGLGSFLWSGLVTALNALYVTVGTAVLVTTDQTVAGIKTFTSSVILHTSGVTSLLRSMADGARATISVLSYRNNSSQSFIQMLSARGSLASPSVSLVNDIVAGIEAGGYSGAAGTFLVGAYVRFFIDATPDSGGDTSDMPMRIVMATAPDGTSVPVEAFWIDNQGNVAVGSIAPPTGVRMSVLQATLGNTVHRLQSTATNDDAIQDFLQGRVATTNATVTTLFTMAIPAAHLCFMQAFVMGFRTGGVSGAANDCAIYEIRGAFVQSGGVAVISFQNQVVLGESQPAWDCVFDVTGTDARIRVTGAASNNITWQAHVFHRFYST